MSGVPHLDVDPRRGTELGDRRQHAQQTSMIASHAESAGSLRCEAADTLRYDRWPRLSREIRRSVLEQRFGHGALEARRTGVSVRRCMPMLSILRQSTCLMPRGCRLPYQPRHHCHALRRRTDLATHRLCWPGLDPCAVADGWHLGPGLSIGGSSRARRMRRCGRRATAMTWPSARCPGRDICINSAAAGPRR